MATVIGLTGQFGSGCTTLKNTLVNYYKLKAYSFGELIKKEAKSRGLKDYERQDLQDIGNEMRNRKLSYWADIIIQKINQSTHTDSSYVVDGFRNVSEIRAFQSVYPETFFLIAINVEDQNLRWKRVKGSYDNDYDKFLRDDQRDRGERFIHGQQVAKCVYEADIVLRNSKSIPDVGESIPRYIEAKVRRYVELIQGETEKWGVSQEERNMQEAYEASSESPCLNRKVGASLYSKRGSLISTGFNGPPFMGGCEKMFGGCHKTLIIDKLTKNIWVWMEGRECPKCKKPMRNLIENECYCTNCGFDVKTFLNPIKGSEHCMALHAEERAISNANKNLKGATIFTTTFPCLQCALKIVEARISDLYYVDPYPIPETDWIVEHLFDLKKVLARKFEGVKSVRAYRKFFPNTS